MATAASRLTKEERKRTRASWSMMLCRCFNKNHSSYFYYGARGITVCDRWRESFDAFAEDMGVRPEGMSIDRINNDGNYEPSNCRWATQSEQGFNSSRARRYMFRGQTKTILEWSSVLGISVLVLSGRLKRHPPEIAFDEAAWESRARKRNSDRKERVKLREEQRKEQQERRRAERILAAQESQELSAKISFQRRELASLSKRKELIVKHFSDADGNPFSFTTFDETGNYACELIAGLLEDYKAQGLSGPRVIVAKLLEDVE